MQLGLAAKAGAIFLLLDEALLEFGFAGSSQRGASLPRVGAATAVLCSAGQSNMTATPNLDVASRRLQRPL